MRVFSFRWSWTANAVDLNSAQTFCPITVPLHSAGLIPINQLSRNEGRFSNRVCAAPVIKSSSPLITVSVSPLSGNPLHRRRGWADVEGHSQSHTWILCSSIQKRQQERLRRIQKPTQTGAGPHGSCASYSESGCCRCKLRRGGGYVRLGYAFYFVLHYVNSCSQGWKQATCVCACVLTGACCCWGRRW